jgi:hypothetical protein
MTVTAVAGSRPIPALFKQKATRTSHNTQILGANDDMRTELFFLFSY